LRRFSPILRDVFYLSTTNTNSATVMCVHMNDAWKWVVGIVVLYIIWRMLFVKAPAVIIPQNIITTGTSGGDAFSESCGTISAGVSEPCTESAPITHPPLHIVFPVAPQPAPAPTVPSIRTANKISNSALLPGQALKSPNGIYEAILQSDGNFVVYKNYQNSSVKPIWDTETYGRTVPVVSASMTPGGNFVLYDANNTNVWATWSSGTGAFMIMQDDGNLVIYASDGKTPLWSTGTYQGSASNPNPAAAPTSTPIISATGIRWGTSPTSPIRPVLAYCGNGPGWCINKLDQLANNPGCRFSGFVY